MDYEFMQQYNDVSKAGASIYLNPEETYSYEEIIKGTYIQNKLMMAVDKSTFQAFGYHTPNMFKVQESYINYFIENKISIVESLNSVQVDNDIEELEMKLFSDMFSMLENNTDKTRLKSYNRIRKPINLYVQHISFMSKEINNRQNISKCLLIPLDKIIFGKEQVFTEKERKLFGISEYKGFGQIERKSLYDEIQCYIKTKANKIEAILGKPFKPIYFDLFWKDRYLNSKKNLFYSNIKIKSNNSFYHDNDMMEVNNDEGNKEDWNYNNNNVISSSYVNEENIITKIKSAPNFYERYKKADCNIRKLFIELINLSVGKGIVSKVTKTPDYRLVREIGTNFCLINLTRKSLKVKLHRNNLVLNLDMLTFKKIAEGRHNGPDWIEIEITTNKELEEVFKLILIIYKNNPNR